MPDQRRWTLQSQMDGSGPDCEWFETRVDDGPELEKYERVEVIEAKVTDEMCDRAIRALHPNLPGKPAQSERDWIRPALEAAING